MATDDPNYAPPIPDAPDPEIDVSTLTIPEGYLLVTKRDLFLLRFQGWSNYPFRERMDALGRMEDLLGCWR